MSLIIERWLSGSVWRYGLLFVAITIVLMLTAWLSLIKPQYSQVQQLETRNEQANQRVAELRRKIRAITLPEPHAILSVSSVFSVTDVVRQSNGHLLKWQPDDNQGTLEMLIPWEKLPSLFIRLAEYPVVSGHAFTVTAQGELLKLELTMEFTDES